MEFVEIAGWVIYMDVDTTRLMTGRWWKGGNHVPNVQGSARVFREGGRVEKE